jgi:hypothetical protein
MKTRLKERLGSLLPVHDVFHLKAIEEKTAAKPKARYEELEGKLER